MAAEVLLPMVEPIALRQRYNFYLWRRGGVFYRRASMYVDRLILPLLCR